MKLPFINEGIFEPHKSPLERGKSLYIPNGGKLQYKECEQMRALGEGWRKHK